MERSSDKNEADYIKKRLLKRIRSGSKGLDSLKKDRETSTHEQSDLSRL